MSVRRQLKLLGSRREQYDVAGTRNSVWEWSLMFVALPWAWAAFDDALVKIMLRGTRALLVVQAVDSSKFTGARCWYARSFFQVCFALCKRRGPSLLPGGALAS